MNNEYYFVGCDDDMPERIYFTKDEAFASGHIYIDSFDEFGKRVESYELTEDGYKIDF